MESASDAPQRTPVERLLILMSVTLATSLYSMTLMIVTVVLPQVQGSLSTTQDQIALVLTFNLVATAVVTPMTGWLVARFGRRRLMLTALVGFISSTILCGLATSLPSLVAFRILQGAFGAPMIPVAQAVTLDTYPPHQRGFAQSVFGMGVVVAPALGPILGGYLTETYNWRWAFFIIVPFGAAALAGVWAFVREDRAAPATRLDWTGFLTLSASVVALQLTLDRGQRLDWFSAPEIVIECTVAVVALYLFVAHTFTAKRPFIDPKLLLYRNFCFGLLLVAMYGMVNFTPMALLPPLLEGVGGYPSSIIGLLVGMRGVGAIVGFFAAIYFGKLDPRIGMLLGFALLAGAGWHMGRFDPNVGVASVVLTSVVQGFAIGVAWVPLTIATFSTLDRRHLADATALFHLLRNIGSSVFISVSVAVIQRTTQVNYAELGEKVTPYRESLSYPGLTGLWTTETLQGLASLSREIGRQSTMIGYLNAFHLYAFACVAVLPFILAMRRARPRAAGGA
jgi:DHA2 family multidrug resistance protein